LVFPHQPPTIEWLSQQGPETFRENWVAVEYIVKRHGSYKSKPIFGCFFKKILPRSFTTIVAETSLHSWMSTSFEVQNKDRLTSFSLVGGRSTSPCLPTFTFSCQLVSIWFQIQHPECETI
jgi:hypothetical protein